VKKLTRKVSLSGNTDNEISRKIRRTGKHDIVNILI
jgi:hypothetical protein